MIEDAILPGSVDAFDGGFTFRVGADWYDSPDPQDLTGATVTGNPVSLSGLNVSAQYQFDQSVAIVRHLVTLTNPTGSTINSTITFESNPGSDSSTQVDASSSGDTTFGVNDNWVVTSDGFDGDPVLTHVLYGPGSPLVTPSSVSMTLTLDEAGTQGVLAEYDLSIAAGETQRLMFFGELTETAAEAITNATFWSDAQNVLDAGLVSDLSEAELSSIVNWSGIPEPTAGLLALFGLMAATASRRS